MSERRRERIPPVADRTTWLAILALAGLGVYLAAFYAAGLPTMEQVTGHVFRRLDYWQFLLLPEVLFQTWFGEPPEFSLLDRLPVFALAFAITACSAAVGWLLLAAAGADRLLTRLESLVFSTAVGLATVSTYTLAVGLLGWLRHPLAFLPLAVLSLAAFSRLWPRRASEPASRDGQAKGPSARTTALMGPAPVDWLDPRWLWLAAPFAIVILLGGTLPPVDFDVLEYHLQAPKEFYEQGFVGFMPHNVYANMPLGVSMFSLVAMSLTGDWWLGALVGKTIVALTAPLTAAALLAAGRRLHSNTAGVFAAVVYLSTPWVAHVAMAGLVESPLAMYSFLAVYAAVILPQRMTEVAGVRASASSGPLDAEEPDGQRPCGTWYSQPLLAGYLAGAAAACKYPAMLFVVLPLAAWVAFRREKTPEASPAGRRTDRTGEGWFTAVIGQLRLRWKPIVLFLCAVVLGGGLWCLKNLILTGNPVFPLLFGVFGDGTGTWNAASNSQWALVHSPGSFSIVALAGDLFRVFLASEWLGPLLFPLALLALPGRSSRRVELVLVGYFILFLAAWWLLTHRIDRFWIPVLPVVGVLSGVGAARLDRGTWRRALMALLVATSMVNLLVIVSPAPGNYKRFFLSLQSTRSDPLRVSPWHRHFNAHRPEGTLLLVGDAAVFDLDVPILYSTCFDETPLRRLASLESETESLSEKGDRHPGSRICIKHEPQYMGASPRFRADSPSEPALASSREIRRRFAEAGVSHVLVHWGEIARYRATYGFDSWVQPALFDNLVASGVLVPLPTIDEYPARAYRVLRP